MTDVRVPKDTMKPERVRTEVGPLISMAQWLTGLARQRIVGVCAPDGRELNLIMSTIGVASWLAHDALEIDRDSRQRGGTREGGAEILDADTRKRMLAAVAALDKIAGIELRRYDDTARSLPPVDEGWEAALVAFGQILTPVN